MRQSKPSGLLRDSQILAYVHAVAEREYMTKKDYILIAASIRSAYKALTYATVNRGETDRSTEIIVNQLSVALYNDNNHFNEDKFKKAIFE